MSQPDMGSIFHIKINEIFCSKETIILVYKFRPERTGFNMYVEYTQLQLTFLALEPWVKLAPKKSLRLQGYPQRMII